MLPPNKTKLVGVEFGHVPWSAARLGSGTLRVSATIGQIPGDHGDNRLEAARAAPGERKEGGLAAPVRKAGSAAVPKRRFMGNKTDTTRRSAAQSAQRVPSAATRLPGRDGAPGNLGADRLVLTPDASRAAAAAARTLPSGTDLQSLSGTGLQSLSGTGLQSLSGTGLQALSGSDLQILSGAEVQALRDQLASLTRNLPGSLDQLRTWLPDTLNRLQGTETGLRSTLQDLSNRLDQGATSFKEVEEAANHADDSFRALEDRLKAIDPDKLAERGPLQDPGKPQSGRRIFPANSVDQKARGESWAKPPAHPSISVTGGASVQSSVPFGQMAGVAGQAGAKGDAFAGADAVAGLAARNPAMSATGSGEIELRTRHFDFSAGVLAGAAGSLDGKDAADFYRTHRDLPGEVQGLIAQAGSLDAGARVAELNGRMSAAMQQFESLRLQTRNPANAQDIVTAIRTASQAVIDARSVAADANALIGDMDRLAGDARATAGRLSDQTRRMTVDVAGGAVGRVRATGRVPLPSPGKALRDLNLAVSGQIVMAGENPAYDPALTDRPQLKYTLGAIRSRATVWIEGTDRLRAVLDDSRKLAAAAQGAVGAADQLLATLGDSLRSAAPAAADLARIQAEIEALRDQLSAAAPGLEAGIGSGDPAAALQALQNANPTQVGAALGQTDVAGLLARIESLRSQIAAIPLPDPAQVARVGTELDKVTEANHALVADLDAFEREFRVKADVTARVVQPTTPFGAGLGLGLSGTLDLGHPVSFAVTADNLAGIMPGKEETWRLKDPRGKAGTFEKVGERKRDVYGDFFPPTYRLSLGTMVKSTTLRADWEKVEGLDGINQLYGVEQQVGNYLKLRGGVEDAPAFGRKWAPYAGVEVGPRKGGWAVWATGTADSLGGKDIKQAGVNAGLRIEL